MWKGGRGFGMEGGGGGGRDFSVIVNIFWGVGGLWYVVWYWREE
jgi:hypothetical protein